MKRNVMRRNLLRTIRRSLTRFIAIVAIIALGAALFVGLLATKTDMIATGQSYLDEQNMFDLALINPYGWSSDQLERIRNLHGVVDAEGVISLDVIGTTGSSEVVSAVGSGEDEGVYQLYAIPESVDMPFLLGGRMPQTPNECLIDGHFSGDDVVGTVFRVSSNNDKQTLESLSYREYTVVGYVSTPIFLDMTRGNTTLGNGSVTTYLYIPREGFQTEVYSRIHVTIPGDYQIYSQEYDDAMTRAGDELKPLVEPILSQRYEQVKQEAQDLINEGTDAYAEGVQAYEEGWDQASGELADAAAQLEAAQKEIEENELLLKDGQRQIEDARLQLEQAEKELADGKKQLQDAKATTLEPLLKQKSQLQENVNASQGELSATQKKLQAVEEKLEPIQNKIQPLEQERQTQQGRINVLNSQLASLDGQIGTIQLLLRSGLIGDDRVQELEKQLLQLQDQRNAAVAQRQEARNARDQAEQALEPYYVLRQPLAQERTALQAQLVTQQTALTANQAALAAVEPLVQAAKEELSQAQEQITAGEKQLSHGKRQLAQKEQELTEGWQALEDGKQQLFDGWQEFYSGQRQAHRELSKAKDELDDVKNLLDDAHKLLNEIGDPQLYILDRNSNIGYCALENNSNIVAGVSRVFPVFFILVAALVCITTMTRMVEEERTQIGTLKAIGYTKGSIMRKYLLYAGIAAVAGCGIGCLLGSLAFPNILWNAYKLIINMRHRLDLVINWPVCIAITFAYTVAMCLVTWYCSRRALKEVPAELIRPKPPTSGKKVFLERFRIWNRVSFLNKVMLRNVFRYRQRLLMMLVGIGGCTALLMTGFGIGDSIMDILEMQYEKVTLYHIQTQFSEGTDIRMQEKFRKVLGPDVEGVAFAYQSGVDLEFDGTVKNINLIVPEGDLNGFFDFHCGEEALAMPGPGEAMLSSGTAEAMGIQAGDTVVIRDTDMHQIALKISSVYDNYVYNFILAPPESVQPMWQEPPEYQMAYVKLADGADAHAVGARISAMEEVMSILINQDLADQVGAMLEAMNLVVATVIICAALLAVIVVYNLTNINITERLREIATIKVLGFTPWETALYVFKENMILTGMGILLGFAGGKPLLTFVMSQIKIDMVWFEAILAPWSVVWSVLITVFAALGVEFVLHFKLEKINMAEALKPVE